MQRISFHYTLFSESGSILDSNQDNKPITIVVGKGQFIPYVEEVLLGVSAGQATDIVIPPEKGFGEHNPELVKETDKQNLPGQLQQVGTLVELVDDLGRQRNAKVVSSTDNTVTLDFNHPFAGKTLICSVKVVLNEAIVSEPV